MDIQPLHTKADYKAALKVISALIAAYRAWHTGRKFDSAGGLKG